MPNSLGPIWKQYFHRKSIGKKQRKVLEQKCLDQSIHQFLSYRILLQACNFKGKKIQSQLLLSLPFQ